MIVSTDCPIIRDISLDAGAEVVGRPDEISGDTSPSELAVIDAITQIGYDDTYVLMIQCTSPLTQPEDILGVVTMLESGFDSVFTASRFHGFVWKDREPVNHLVHHRPMRQDTNQFLENGAVYGFETKGFLEYKHRFFGNIGMYEMPAERSLEIDEPHDLVIAEAMIEIFQ
jgi:N-acylneuraminate cytidylyltransferase